MKETSYSGFEQGPIRPPSEAESLLIRITRNCPWNRCTFCPVYKDRSFSVRPLEHVLRDIETVCGYVESITGGESPKTGNAAPAATGNMIDVEDIDESALHAAYHFIAGGQESIFLQDGNSLVIKPADMIEILQHLRKCFPSAQRITSYARSHTVARISDEHLLTMAESGLNRIHIGLESGSDKVLRRIKKGVDKETQIKAGLKIKKAGMQLSEYYMPGLGGRTLMQENALETADALNQINPDYIRLRSLAIPSNTPLHSQFETGKFDKMGDVDTAREILIFLKALGNITSTIRSDHILNLFAEIDGNLQEERNRMIDVLEQFIELPPYEQMLFCVGRRTGRMSRLTDLNNPAVRGYAEEVCHKYSVSPNNMDQVIAQLMKRFI